MIPEQFLAKLTKQSPAPAYLFLGQEGYQRRVCRQALIERVLPAESREEGFNRIDLENTSLSEVLDDAKSLSLFTRERVLWVDSAELALPRRMTSVGTEESEEAGEKNTAQPLADYLRQPTPGTVLVFDCSRYDFSGDDRPKLERVEKFYAALPAVVEFRQFSPESIRFLAQQLAKQKGLKLAGMELAMLLEAVAGDASRLVSEIEKLSLFVESDRVVTMEDLRALVPSAAQSTIYALVNSLGKRDRAGALRSLDILVRDREYLPLALTFLSTQFRLALAAKEAKITSSQQAQAFFNKLGVRIWRERAEQITSTAGTFTREQLSRAVALIYETDKKFRDGYREDRIVMESLVLALTAQ
jgi:DNA polymerase-3 subunit delta